MQLEYLCFYVSLMFPSSLLSPPGFCHYCIMNALRGLLMHSKCHIVTEPVTPNDYLVLVSNALYSIYSLWDVMLMFVCVCVCIFLNKQTTLEPGSCPHTTCDAGCSSLP